MKLFTIGLAAAAVLAAPAAALVPSKFVVFGDSFIDAGSVNSFSGNTLAPSSLGFWQGRWSDGPTWADQLGYANFGSPTPDFYGSNPPGVIPGTPGFVYTPGASNFAVGGARASGDDGLIPGLNTQLGLYSQYLGATGDLPDASTLFIINFGNNDVTAILQAVGPVAQAAVAQAYVTNMVNAVIGLTGAGAKHILVLGVPNPARLPGPALQAALDTQLNAIAPLIAAQGTSLYRFDYFAFFNSLVADPTQYDLPAGLITTPPRNCLAELGPLANCENYLSFDGIHVTKGVHRALGIEIGNLVGLAVIPEPATWAMLIAGFGLVGVAARRRRSALAG